MQSLCPKKLRYTTFYMFYQGLHRMEENVFSSGGTEQKEEGEPAVQGVNCFAASGSKYGRSARQSVSRTAYDRLPAPEGPSQHPAHLRTVFSLFK